MSLRPGINTNPIAVPIKLASLLQPDPKVRERDNSSRVTVRAQRTSDETRVVGCANFSIARLRTLRTSKQNPSQAIGEPQRAFRASGVNQLQPSINRAEKMHRNEQKEGRNAQWNNAKTSKQCNQRTTVLGRDNRSGPSNVR